MAWGTSGTRFLAKICLTEMKVNRYVDVVPELFFVSRQLFKSYILPSPFETPREFKMLMIWSYENIISRTLARFSGVITVDDSVKCWSSSTDSRPSVKRLNYSKVLELLQDICCSSDAIVKMAKCSKFSCQWTVFVQFYLSLETLCLVN